VRFQGRFALLRQQGPQVLATALVGARSLKVGEWGRSFSEPAAAGKIVAVDRAKQTVDVDWPCTKPKALVGRTVRFHNDRRTCAYAVTKAERVRRGTRLTLGTSSLVGEGAMTGVEDYIIHNSAAFFFSGLQVKADGTRTPTYRLYVGATLENEDRSTTLPVEGITGGSYWGSPGDIYLDCKLAPNATADRLKQVLTDTNGDGLASFRIYDYGVGDAFEMPHCASFEIGRAGAAGGSGLIQVEASTGVEVSVPRCGGATLLQSRTEDTSKAVCGTAETSPHHDSPRFWERRPPRPASQTPRADVDGVGRKRGLPNGGCWPL